MDLALVVMAAGLAPLAFFPISIYLGLPEIKKRLPVEGNRRARMSCRVASAASEPAAGASWSGHQMISGQRGKG